MKLKYKKMILLTAMSTMGIGILTLSVSSDKTNAKESMNNQLVEKSDTLVEDNTAEASVASAFGASFTFDEPTTAPTPSPTPAPLPVYPMEQGTSYPEIDNLINQYYTAKIKRDVDAINALLTDPSNGFTKDDLNSKTEYISDYRNIKTYVKKSFKEGTYIVYVYHEIKFTNIETPAPGLAVLYVVTDENGNLKIFSGKMDKETYDYYNERANDEDVIALVEMTNKNSEKAISGDEYLSFFWNSIKEFEEKLSNGTAEGGTADASGEGQPENTEGLGN